MLTELREQWDRFGGVNQCFAIKMPRVNGIKIVRTELLLSSKRHTLQTMLNLFHLHFFYIFLVIIVVRTSLLCYCSHCPNDEATCKVPKDGQCFTTARREYVASTGEYEQYYEYGCNTAEQKGGFLQV